MGSSAGSVEMLDAFTQLGTKIHEDSLESMNYFQALEKAKRDRERQQRLDAENTRRLNINAGISRRQQDLAGIGLLAELRRTAEENARTRAFRQALTQ